MAEQEPFVVDVMISITVHADDAASAATAAARLANQALAAPRYYAVVTDMYDATGKQVEEAQWNR